MADDSLTHKDLAQALGVSETTIKSYRRKFPGCLPVVSRGKPLRFAPKAMEVCRAIRQGFAAGLSVEDLRGRLAEAYAWCAPRPASAGAGTASAGEGLGRAAQGDALAELAQAVRGLAEAQQGVVERLAALEQRLESLAGVPPAPGAGVPVSASVPGRPGVQAPATPQAPDKVVRIRTRQGSVERYGLSRMDEEAGAESAPEIGAAPPADFLVLPMVIRNDSGEFLGIAGLSIEEFGELMRRKAGSEQPLPARWERLDEAWVLHLGGAESGQAHTLHLERTTTPRGNEVVWLRTLLVADDPMSDADLHAFLRQLRRDFD